MSSIDSRVVEMKFNNAQFEAGVQKTLGSLASLKQGLRLEGATKGLTDISAVAGKGISLQNISAGVDQISSKFSAMSVIGIAALASLAAKAASVGAQMIKSLSIQQVVDGFKDYELKVGATQNIMAGTGENIQTTTKYLKELDIYADQTIYNLRDMTSNIGKFTNAGVKLPVAVEAMKGIANVAALSGANSEEAARAMYNLGQAIGQGTVKLMDWKSVELANMGTMEFKQQLMDSAVAMGTLKKGTDGVLKTTKGTIVTTKNFSTTLQDQWLTADALTKTLSNYASKTTEIGKKAWKAATEVKSFSMMTETLKASAGTGWTDTFEIALGTLPEATAMFTSLTNVIGGFIGASADARNKVLGDWKALGGRTMLISAISNAFNALMAVIKPIKDAFRAIFPAATGQQLYNITEALNHFTEKLKIGGDTAFKLQRIFQGVFAIFDIGWMVIKQGINFFARLFGAVAIDGGGFLSTLAKIGDWFNNLRYAIKNGEGLEKFFRGLSNPLVVIIKLLSRFANAIGQVFSGIGNVDVGGLENLKIRFEPLGKLGETIANIWSRVGGFFKSAWTAFSPIADAFSSFFENIGKTIQDSFGSINYSTMLDTINTGLLAGLVLILKKFMKDGLQIGVNADVGGGMFASIKEAFGGLTDTMKAMQMSLKADVLLKIAAAIGLLTLSVVALSMIDSGALTKALAAMTFMFTQLMVSMALFEKLGATKGFLKMPFVTASMILLAIAIDLLAIAVSKLAKLSWEELAKGLIGVTVLIGALVFASQGMAKSAKGMISTGAGLVIMAVGIKILASAVADLSGLSWEEMAKGLVGVGALLGALALFTQLSKVSKGGVVQGAGLILLAVGIKILASAMGDFAAFSWDEIGRGLVAMGGGLALMGLALALIPPSSVLSAAAILIVASSLGMIADALGQMGGMEWETIGKGITALAGALTLIAAALILIPPSSLLSAAAVLVVAASLGMIATALEQMGGMSWEEIAKGLVALAGSLTIIAVAMYAMTGAIPGALALLVVASSLAILAPVLMMFGSMSWESMGKGLLMLAGVFVVLGVAGLLLTPIIPTLLGLGVAIVLLGVGMLAAGAGLLLFSVGLTALSVAGAAGTVAIVGIVSGLIGLIPMLMTQIGLGVVAFAKVISTAGPAITGAITTVLNSLINAIAKLTPKIVTTLLNLLVMLLAALANAVPKMVVSGMKLITGILTGIAANIGKVVTAAASVIVGFINGISNNLGRIIQAGVNLILKFVNGVTTAINNNSAAMGVAGGNLAMAIVQGMARGIAGGLGVVVNAAKNLASSALNAAKSALGIKSPSKEFAKLGVFTTLGFAKGVTGSLANVKASLASMGAMIKTTISSTAKDVAAAQKKLAAVKANPRSTRAQIRAASNSLKQSQILYANAKKADVAFNKWLTTQKAGLIKLGTQYDAVTTKLNVAKTNLADAQKLRDDFAKTTAGNFDVLPEIDPRSSVISYEKALIRETAANNKFKDALAKLRLMGMDDTTYNKLLSEGVTVQPFLDKLLNGGPEGLKELNALNAAFASSATNLGAQAAKDLYQAGVDSAQGIVNGLASQQKLIETQMNKIGQYMVASIKRQLGIKSPSRVFMEVGRFSNEGLAKGLDKYSGVVEKSAAGVGSTAIDSMRKSISGMSDLIIGDMDMTPVIRPVLDLTDMQKDSLKIDALLNTKPISVDAAYSTAKDASAGYLSNQAALAQASQAGTVQENLTFVQNNNSPKALSSAEIYRQTKNQLSVAKGALTT